jgi:hypothetical protein
VKAFLDHVPIFEDIKPQIMQRLLENNHQEIVALLESPMVSI